MKITKARLKQIIKEEMKSLEEKKNPLAPGDYAARRAALGQATWEDEEDAQQSLPSDTQTPASAADINPIGGSAVGPRGRALDPMSYPTAYSAATEPELRASIPGVGDDVPVTKSGEAIGQGQKQAAAERRAGKAAKSGGGGLKAAKARMSAARKKVKIAMKKAGVSSIYKLPKTDGSPRKEFADAYTALKRAKAGKAPKPRLKSDPKSPRAMGKPAPKTSPTRTPKSGAPGAPSTYGSAMDQGAKADANKIVGAWVSTSQKRGGPQNRKTILKKAYNYAAKNNPMAAGEIKIMASNEIGDKFANSLGKKTVKKESKSLDRLVDLIMEKMINENI